MNRLWFWLLDANWKARVRLWAQALFLFAIPTFYINRWQGVSVDAAYFNSFVVPVAVFGHRKISDLVGKLASKLTGKELTDAVEDGAADFWVAVIAAAMFIGLHSMIAG